MKKKMKRVLPVFALLVLFCIGGYLLFIQNRSYRIICLSSDVTDCQRQARKGETVTVATVSISDGELCLYVDGVEIAAEQEGIYRFVMPGHDVDITTVIIPTYNYDTLDSPIYFEIKTPVKAHYDRLWEYSDSAETEDPEMLEKIVDALRIITIGPGPVDVAIDDYTDRIFLTYEDGSEACFVFEADYYISDLNGGHYPVTQGLKELRSVLDRIIANKGE
ncbi:MAG: hypothetical protein IKS51_05780 [Erysipelotrichaceae bacterium]|nr:hypothetical protein [Erysipelotrichaceae bacterium]